MRKVPPASHVRPGTQVEALGAVLASACPPLAASVDQHPLSTLSAHSIYLLTLSLLVDGYAGRRVSR